MPLLSLCMIVRNEHQHLARCLASAQPYVDEIVVVDTGSDDDTIAIAQQFGAIVHSFAWCDDFAAARNFALDHVSGDWILILDADETLVVTQPEFRQQLGQDPNVIGYALVRTDIPLTETELTGGVHIRLFRGDRGLRYTGRYHEQLHQPNGQPLAVTEFPALKIQHYGNSDEQAVLQKTIQRDIPLLEKMRQEGELSLWLLDCLARNYQRIQNHGQAQACYAEALDRLLPHLMNGDPPADFFWVPTLMWTLAEQALEADDLEIGRMLLQRGLEWCPTHAPLNYLTGEFLVQLGFPLGAIPYFSTCLQLGQTNTYYQVDPCPLPLISTEPACALGRTYRHLGQIPAAIESFQFALSFDPDCPIARDNLEELLGES